MQLSELLNSISKPWGPVQKLGSESDPIIRSIEIDSRVVAPGALFVAIEGENHDGHDHLQGALENGAVAFLVQDLPDDFPAQDLPVFSVPDTRRALAPVATAFYGEPAGDLALVGITGTNGKTSTSYIVESILKQADWPTGVIGTVEIRYAQERRRSLNTTPESLDLQRSLRTMHSAGMRAVVMEISSHGLALGRVEGCKFRVAAFTNLTQDHLDFHDDMRDYLDSKLELFNSYLADGAAAVINVDDEAAPEFLAAAKKAKAKIMRVSRNVFSDAEIRLGKTEISIQGTRGELHLPGTSVPFEFPLLGAFNLENLVVAVGVALAMEIPPEVIAKGIANCPQVPGRTEHVSSDDSGAPTVIVDYAHTPDAVEQLLESLKALTRGKLITLFGCGGDRDRSKRPLMAEAAMRWSDRIILTSDNPRTEDPEAILSDVETGLSELTRTSAEKLAQQEGAYCVLPDRRTAIQLAIAIAAPEDTVVIAGKGHEDYQIIGRERLPFDDCREARNALAFRATKKEGGKS
jgi:UDP-N-acetylmuramoyl-L-alanyl-D-glutamate--2,6-diaminopimelate ligase